MQTVNFDNRLQVIEQFQINGGGKGKGDGKGGWEVKPTVFVKAKEQIPDKMDEDVTKWREWKDSFLSYSDTLRPGMKAWLNKVERLVKSPEESEIKDDEATWKLLDRQSLWSGIKACTTG